MCKDESILNKDSQENQAYLDDLAVAVCINGDQLEKYEKMVVKQCGSEAFTNMKMFVEEVSRCIERGLVTNTSIINLNYLGKNAGLSEETIVRITQDCERQIKTNPQKKENEFWLNCKTLQDYQSYLDQYPNGIYRNSAQTKISELSGIQVQPLSKEPEKKSKKKVFFLMVALFLSGLMFFLLLGTLGLKGLFMGLICWIVDIAMMKAKWETEAGISRAWRYVLTGLVSLVVLIFVLVLLV